MTDRKPHDDEDDVFARVGAIVERTHAAVTAAIEQGLRNGEDAPRHAEFAVATAKAGAEEAVQLAQTSVAKLLRRTS